MRIHREGFRILVIIFILLAVLSVIAVSLTGSRTAVNLIALTDFLLLVFFLRFFRKPDRHFIQNPKGILAPADGEIVVIEEVLEDEYFHDKRIQISIFMSVWDVHINWLPVPGTVVYKKYHPGKYLIARHPKSSTENERSTVVIKRPDGTEILVRQIAGFVARKISTYPETNQVVKQGDELGFIKFGSRVDLFLPLNSKVNVHLNETSVAKLTILADC
jgi:phosphatidylserine decarboxylase